MNEQHRETYYRTQEQDMNSQRFSRFKTKVYQSIEDLYDSPAHGIAFPSQPDLSLDQIKEKIMLCKDVEEIANVALELIDTDPEVVLIELLSLALKTK